ncbi:cohesin domain-containing protein [Microbacterium sp. zg.Y909]|uniref:cohesin domain-containing protein n=1 Tax=Microbacterium sp. zg.Y909 TaxID=2969413 RepID=UPI00214B425F|nr:cohesin domain-containing protein [Microbacterium sp. zg.Y909]MCR2823955.1 cohesin domain-containing protein [Microbacterium sp. zg.Y909]
MPETTLPARPRRARTRALALLTAALAVFGGSLAVAPAAHAATGVTVTTPGAATAGDTVTVTVAADAGADLFAYDLTLGYDPALLAFAPGSETYPTGGYGAATESPGTVTFTSTRLGTSPGLTGPHDLVTFSFTALTSGAATISLDAATFLDSASAAQSLPQPVTATVEIAAAPVTPTPTPAPGAPGTPGSPGTPSAGMPAAGAGAADGAASDPADSAAGSLAGTGGDIVMWIVAGAAGIALLALGVVLMVRRRRGEVAL